MAQILSSWLRHNSGWQTDFKDGLPPRTEPPSDTMPYEQTNIQERSRCIWLETGGKKGGKKEEMRWGVGRINGNDLVISCLGLSISQFQGIFGCLTKRWLCWPNHDFGSGAYQGPLWVSGTGIEQGWPNLLTPHAAHEPPFGHLWHRGMGRKLPEVPSFLDCDKR